jgi:hypothetical protein
MTAVAVRPDVRVTLRDPVVDLVRVVAVAGVVGGHWLVTALVTGVNGLSVDSPLRWLPQFTPLSWVCQTLGLFFLTGGYAAAASLARSTSPVRWWFGVLRRLAVPVGALLGCWAVALLGLAARGMSQVTALTVVYLVVTPLWFLGVYLLLLAITPLARALDRRFGVAAALVPAGAALAVHLAVAAGAPTWLGQSAELLVWWVPWQLGIAWRTRQPRTALAAGLLVAGVVGYVAAVVWGGCPVSAVGVPGQLRSNLAPPSVATLALAVAQTGVVWLARPALSRLVARRRVAAAVAAVNRRALPVFLLHQSALAVVTLVAGAFGVLPGLHTAPDHPGWLLARLAWLPVLAAVLTALLALLGRLRELRPNGRN